MEFENIRLREGGDDHRVRRWQQEAAFFDDWAARVQDRALPLDPLTMKRYSRRPLRRRFSMEFRFRLLGDMRDKAILDVGCGDGLNSVLLAKLGARVTGVDVSQRCLELAERRASANGVSERVRFVCSPIEKAELPAGSFDVVWGDGILHHVLDELEAVLTRLSALARPGGLLVFSEPVNLSEALRRVRRWIPVRTKATPGERPLVPAEIELIKRYVPDLKLRHYRLLERLDRFVLAGLNYEKSSALRRAIYNGLEAVDYLLLSVPPLQRLAGTCVLHGSPRRSM